MKKLSILLIFIIIISSCGNINDKLGERFDKRKWWVSVEGEAKGPYNRKQLKEIYLEPETMVLLDGTNEWVKAERFPEILKKEEEAVVNQVPEINIYEDPVQGWMTNKVIRTENYDGYDWTITAVNTYKLSGKVRGVKSYYWGWNAHFAPVDLNITWGKVNTPEAEKYITYSQSNRFYHFRYNAGCPLSGKYINDHASNNHIVPANDNVLSAVKGLSAGNIVCLEGYLIKIFGKASNGATKWWNSSTTRTDSGDGACEIIYVTRVIYNNNVYD